MHNGNIHNSRPIPCATGATELRCYGNTARWGSPCTFCLYYYLLCYRKSLMQGHYICFHFINCHNSAILILSEGLEGHWGMGCHSSLWTFQVEFSALLCSALLKAAPWLWACCVSLCWGDSTPYTWGELNLHFFTHGSGGTELPHSLSLHGKYRVFRTIAT